MLAVPGGSRRGGTGGTMQRTDAVPARPSAGTPVASGPAAMAPSAGTGPTTTGPCTTIASARMAGAGPDATAGPRGTGPRRARRRRAILGTLAVLPVALLLAACSTSSSGGGGSGSTTQPDPYPAAVEGAGPNGSFYDIPSVPAGAVPGQVLYYEPESADTAAFPNTDDWIVAYVSTDSSGNPDVVTGTVIVPTAAWTGSGPRPVVDYAPGTQGLGQSCAPSELFPSNGEYESINADAAVNDGYAVLMTDYQWSGTTDTPPPTYVAGISEGHAVLDMARTGAQIPGSGLDFDAPTVVWGYSQGGGAATWAGQLWPSYEPGVNLVGVAAGGVPGNLIDVGESLNGGAFAGLAGDAIIGMASAYPDLPFASLMNSAGQQLVQELETGCVGANIADGAGVDISSLTVGNLTIQQLLAEGNWTPDLLANSPGQPGATISVPTYMYRGDVDEIIPTSVEDQVYATLCADGSVIQSATYAGEHALTLLEAQSDVLTFIAQRLAGDTPTDSCTSDPTNL